MTTDPQDLLNLIEEIRQAKQQLVQAEVNKEQVITQYKQVVDAHDQADREYVNLMGVFEYCVHHDCDPAYAKLMLSAKPNTKSHHNQVGRGSQIQHLPTASHHSHMAGMAGMAGPPPIKQTRTIKQKMVDWMMKS